MNYKISELIVPGLMMIQVDDRNNIKLNQKVKIYALDGEEIFDPDTKEFLGRLERLKSEGKVIFNERGNCIIAVDKEHWMQLQMSDFVRIAETETNVYCFECSRVKRLKEEIEYLERHQKKLLHIIDLMSKQNK